MAKIFCVFIDFVFCLFKYQTDRTRQRINRKIEDGGSYFVSDSSGFQLVERQRNDNKTRMTRKKKNKTVQIIRADQMLVIKRNFFVMFSFFFFFFLIKSRGNY